MNSPYGNLTDCDTMSRGIFLFWWDRDFNYSTQIDEMLDTMAVHRSFCLNELFMQDPLGVQNGYYCNIYIHTPGNPADYFSVNYSWWGNGVGGDSNGNAYMTLPYFVLGNWLNLAHETFHIFQTHGMWDITPGVYNTDDGGWYVEATANWYAHSRYRNDINSFVEAEILVRIPQVPMWLGWINFPNYYPNNWQRQVHQYGFSTNLYYLTNVVGLHDTDLVSVFYSGTTLTPQEYLYNKIGGAAFRDHFIDCAAHMTNNFDFLLPAQASNAFNEWNTYADPADDNQYIQTYYNTGSNGWYRPADSLTTNAWSFNTYKLSNTNIETYTFEINGDPTGSYGDSSYFQGKVLVQNSVTGASFHDLIMSNDVQGSLTLNLTPDDTAVYFIIASMPEVFTDNNPTFQYYPYTMRIVNGPTGIWETNNTLPKTEIMRYNVLGQQINKTDGGLQFIQYSDGSVRKVFIQKQ